MGASEVWSSGIDPDFVVTTRGPVPPAEVTRLVRGLGRILRRHGLDGPVRARLDWPGTEGETTLVQAGIRALGKAYRVQVAGPGRFATTFALERLDLRLGCPPDETSRPWPDPARPDLGVVSAPSPIVRRKDCLLQVSTPTAAAKVLDALDYDAHLFTDADSGLDAVVCWAGAGAVRTLRQHRDPVPVLLEDEAAAVLCGGGLPYLFFTDPDTLRGRLLYRRFDGDLTLVTAADAAERPRERALAPRAITTGCVRRPLPELPSAIGATENLAEPAYPKAV